MVAGALLVQNTRWANAERAIAALRERGWLQPVTLSRIPVDDLAPVIRPCGFWKQKAPRLSAFARWLVDSGGFDALARADTGELRRALLSRPGVGPETADCILVYAFGRPVFVADAYARRLVARLDGRDGPVGAYEPVRRRAEHALPADAALLGEFHALIVEHGKRHCGATPVCEGCILAPGCATGSRATGRRSSSR
jgi:endonuclease-3 related protein